MDEVEIEILEPVNDWEKNIAVQAETRIIRVPVQQIIINNEVKTVYGGAVALVCPKCNAIIQQFQTGITEIEVVKALNTDKEEDLNKTMYCHKCGQRLRILRPMPVEASYEVKESAQ